MTTDWYRMDGRGWSFVHASSDGRRAICGYDPRPGLPPNWERVLSERAADDDPRCPRCKRHLEGAA